MAATESCLTNTKFHPCEDEGLVARLGEKWTLMSLLAIRNSENGVIRFSALKNSLSGISQKVLTATLRSLERDGLVRRVIFPTVPPKTEYSLTAMGMGLVPSMRTLFDWQHQHWETIQENRREYDRRGSEGSKPAALRPAP